MKSVCFSLAAAVAIPLFAALMMFNVVPAFAGGKLAACETDIQKFCASATSKHDQKSCLKEHQSALSPACTASFGSGKKAKSDADDTPPTHS